ncbi:MAG: sigma-70 family RNA polymerase sigma factor [Blastocatellia bacterium]
MGIEIEQASDLELVSLAREGDERAFEEIVRRHSPRVFSIASKFLRQRAQVEDAAQEAFLKAYTQLSRYEGRGSFEGWLTRITTNQCINMLRSAKRRPEATVSELTDHEGAWLENQMAGISAERHQSSERGLVASDLAEKILSELPPEDRLVLMSIDGDQLSVKEVAVMTGLSESNVKVKAFRARRRMRKAVEALLARKRTDADEKGR